MYGGRGSEAIASGTGMAPHQTALPQPAPACYPLQGVRMSEQHHGWQWQRLQAQNSRLHPHLKGSCSFWCLV